MIQELIMKIKAGYCLFWIETEETKRTKEVISNNLITLRDMHYWDVEASPDPESALENLDSAPEKSILIAENYHWFLKDFDGPNKLIIQMFLNRTDKWANKGKSFLILTNQPYSFLPDEIKAEFTPITFALPNEKEIKEVLDFTIESAKSNPGFKMPEQTDKIISAAKGMTKKEIENAMFYSVVESKKTVDYQIISRIKAKVVNENGIEYIEFDETFDTLKGYENLKLFTKGTIKNPLAKGIILLGPPGTGKSHFCKCLGNEANLPVLMLEMGSIFSSLVGDSEKKMKRIIDIIKIMSPCIVFIDELEKGLSGAKGTQTDSGTTKRTMAIWLKFMSDRPEGIYIVATCNDITSIPPEYLRAERWDTAPFFIDLPSEIERLEILKHYLVYYNVGKNLTSSKIKSTTEKLIGWSGAEIKSLVRISKMMNLSLDESSKFVVPISKTMEEEITSLRNWAKGKTIPATIEIVKKERNKRKIEV